jgi:hypothetical protein
MGVREGMKRYTAAVLGAAGGEAIEGIEGAGDLLSVGERLKHGVSVGSVRRVGILNLNPEIGQSHAEARKRGELGRTLVLDSMRPSLGK